MEKKAKQNPLDAKKNKNIYSFIHMICNGVCVAKGYATYNNSESYIP